MFLLKNTIVSTISATENFTVKIGNSRVIEDIYPET